MVNKIDVYNFLLTIPKGKVVTYKFIGNKFGIHPRVVAKIVSQNLQQDKYPCYKVICSDGSIGGYNLGVDEKIRRLKNDGIKIVEKESLKSVPNSYLL